MPPDTTDYYLTNKAIGDTYDTVEFGVTKRMSDHWQLISGFDWTKRNLSSLFSEDPNIVSWNSNNTQTTGWTFKASGSYVFKRGVLVGLCYNAMKGEPYGRLFTVTEQYLKLADPNRTTPLVQGNMTIMAEKAGTYYLPAIHVTDVRVQKEFAIKATQRLQLMLNMFNLVDAKTMTGVIQATGGSFGEPTATTAEPSSASARAIHSDHMTKQRRRMIVRSSDPVGSRPGSAASADRPPLSSRRRRL